MLTYRLFGYSLTSHEHASAYMRCPCKGHGVGCLWLLPPKPNTVRRRLVIWNSHAVPPTVTQSKLPLQGQLWKGDYSAIYIITTTIINMIIPICYQLITNYLFYHHYNWLLSTSCYECECFYYNISVEGKRGMELHLLFRACGNPRLPLVSVLLLEAPIMTYDAPLSVQNITQWRPLWSVAAAPVNTRTKQPRGLTAGISNYKTVTKVRPLYSR